MIASLLPLVALLCGVNTSPPPTLPEAPPTRPTAPPTPPTAPPTLPTPLLTPPLTASPPTAPPLPSSPSMTRPSPPMTRPSPPMTRPSPPMTRPSVPSSVDAPVPFCLVSASGRSADCFGKHLESVPWAHLPPTLETIDLSYNKINAIHADDFSRFPNLTVLLLAFNNISHIDDHAFRENTLLENLNIYNNSLREIPSVALKPLQNLKILFMSNNLFERATLAESFADFDKLQMLSLGGPLVMGLRTEDLEPLRNISLQHFSIKCSSNLSYYERGSLKVVQTQGMGIDMALDQKPDALLDMLSDLADKNFTNLQFRNLFEFTYYTRAEDIFRGLEEVTAHRLIFYRGKFNENLLRMLLLNLQKTPTIKRLRLQYIDFARSPSFADSGKESSITNLKLDQLDLW